MNKNFANNYVFLSDEELILLIKESDENAFNVLYERYLPKIRAMVYPFQSLGYDLEDLIQETTIGFFTAINVYNVNSASFSTFCYLCMRRMLISLVKKSNKKGAIPKNNVIYTEVEFTEDNHNNPESRYIAKEEFYRLKTKIMSTLSKTEYNVLTYFLMGMDYSEIGKRLGISKKSVDNALQRVRSKLR